MSRLHLPPMSPLPPHLQDAALQFADAVQCLQGDRRFNAEMIAVAIAEGIRSAKAGELPRTNANWHDSMIDLATNISRTITAG